MERPEQRKKKRTRLRGSYFPAGLSTTQTVTMEHKGRKMNWAVLCLCHQTNMLRSTRFVALNTLYVLRRASKTALYSEKGIWGGGLMDWQGWVGKETHAMQHCQAVAFPHAFDSLHLRACLLCILQVHCDIHGLTSAGITFD